MFPKATRTVSHPALSSLTGSTTGERHPTIRRFCSAGEADVPCDDLMLEIERTRSKDDYIRRRPASMNLEVSDLFQSI